jgi:hypothetical protein
MFAAIAFWLASGKSPNTTLRSSETTSLRSTGHTQSQTAADAPLLLDEAAVSCAAVPPQPNL